VGEGCGEADRGEEERKMREKEKKKGEGRGIKRGKTR